MRINDAMWCDLISGHDRRLTLKSRELVIRSSNVNRYRIEEYGSVEGTSHHLEPLGAAFLTDPCLRRAVSLLMTSPGDRTLYGRVVWLTCIVKQRSHARQRM